MGGLCKPDSLMAGYLLWKVSSCGKGFQPRNLQHTLTLWEGSYIVGGVFNPDIFSPNGADLVSESRISTDCTEDAEKSWSIMCFYLGLEVS